MHYRIDSENPAPAYLQLYVSLRGDIENGVYPIGTRLLSKRLLAEEAGVSVITVEHSYAILCDEGYAEAKPRSGYYVIYRKDDFLSGTDTHPEKPARTFPGKSAVPDNVPKREMSSGTYPFPAFARTMRRVLSEYGEQILIKSPNHGCPQLRGAIASYLTRTLGKSVSAEQVIIGSGAEYLYSLIVQLFRMCGDPLYRTIALESPSYEKIRCVYEANGVVCEMLKLGADGICSEELLRAKAKLLHITPFHSYPSGITADASKRREYLAWAEERGGYLIEDNYDSELTVSTKNDDTVYALAKQPRVLYLNTFSHTIAPSVRVGYLVLPTHLLPVFEKALGFYSCTVPVFEQFVLAELMDSGDFERHINRVRRARRRDEREQARSVNKVHKREQSSQA